MRININKTIRTDSDPNNTYKIIAVDDEMGIIDSLSVYLSRVGYK